MKSAGATKTCLNCEFKNLEIVDFEFLNACVYGKKEVTTANLTFELIKNSKKTYQILTFEIIFPNI